ncbi:hypothetical protein RchiOBHm_Chr7g0234971 [Rosa chinensis]|uniref:Sas10/Utp3/C1D n=1 Tax=Rosa chinensis TaxID=74649 RepID=A0A2P6PGP2_ROSCH|nr:neuroguidin [Rosa chinensis]PRQ21058.1 hypothetical protein RchiOBHm_Chr7g0234971 [Rosa chinensis]
MEDASNSNGTHEDIVNKEAPQLAAVLKEMKEGLDVVDFKVRALTAKVKENQYPTSQGFHYLEAKNMLLLHYCLSLVYYLLRKAKGLSISGHPVVQSLVETRLFLEKIRPIDKKMQYQIEKLTKVTASTTENVQPSEKQSQSNKTEDLLSYRPNPEMIPSKIDLTSEDRGKYIPPKIAPTSMEKDKSSRFERNALRKEENTLRQSKHSRYVRDMVDDFEGRPEEIVESFGAESVELERFKAKLDERARIEEDLFTRAPITKAEKRKAKHLLKSRNGLLDLTENFYEEIKTLPLEEGNDEMSGFSSARGGRSGRGGRGGMRGHKKRKMRH